MVAGSQSLSSATIVRDTAVGSVTSQPRGARLAQASSNSEKPGMERAAMVLTGPADTRFTRMPCGPR